MKKTLLLAAMACAFGVQAEDEPKTLQHGR